MKKLLVFFACILSLGLVLPVSAEMSPDKKEKKEKKKKEKKPYVWKMPALTGNQSFDDYLKLCDDLNNKITAYAENIVFYEVVGVRVMDETGEQEIKYHVVDSVGNLRSANKAFEQNFQLITSYPLIALDMTNLGLATSTATLALTDLGLNSISYAKYLKAGPILIGRGGKEMKEIYQRARAQAKQIKALKAELASQQAANEKLEKELLSIVKKFDIPDHRKTCETIHNYKWLHKNIGARNSEKEKYAICSLISTSPCRITPFSCMPNGRTAPTKWTCMPT